MTLDKFLFIDRDGTLISEATDEQIDSFDKLKFYPGAISAMAKIAKELGFRLVMVSNQDGLGTESFPESTFWPVHTHILETFANEGVVFEEQIIDRTFAKDKAATRKPGTALLQHFIDRGYDKENSFVIGDRINDMVLAKNLGIQGIWLRNNDALGADEGLATPESIDSSIALETQRWDEIYQFLRAGSRRAQIRRTTKETDILVKVNLNGNGQSSIATGLHFFDHMLDQIARHGQIDLLIKTDGDLQVDEHHTIEDTAITLGEAVLAALGDKRGIERYGFCLPMDDSLATVALDFGGRNWLIWEADFKREYVGDVPTEMFMHFFKSFSDAARCNLYIQAQGGNEHHKIEAIFKAFAKAIKMAVKQDPEKMFLPSTKGVL